ncbi:hypothetical protein P167DRAFT_574920 [Morchella conica CCBAS932]|uniref:Uncharacterized protein n=2 Tax=Morchella sect. Distantes TaxID=1051054 RepID=A0A3N4KQG5_9PEZI|nr:hypothetical protein P167DRAFT_574920 [Morchella conica CCBAS932]
MSHPTTPPSTAGYSFVSYPTDYIYGPDPRNHVVSQPQPIQAIQMHQIELPGIQTGATAYQPYYPSNIAYAHMAPMGQQTPPSGPSPMLAHSHLPPSPIMHHPHGNPPPTPPSPDRCSADTKVMRHILTAMTKMQSTMKDLAERQEQILDRMSLLEQRVGRIDDGISTLLQQSEVIVEDGKNIRARVDDTDSQDAFENRLTALMDGVVEKLIGGIGDEIKDIKRLVKDTEKYVRVDPFSWNGKMALGQRYREAISSGEEEEKEVNA